MTDRDEPDRVDALLARAARDDALPEGLMARVRADAAAVQDTRAAAVVLRRHRRWRARRVSWPSLGGVGGLVAAGCAGFWLGVSPPEALPDPADVLFGAGLAAAEEETVEIYAFGWDIDDE